MARGEHYENGQLVTAASTAGTPLGKQYKTELVAPQRNTAAEYQLTTPTRSFGMSMLYQVLEQEYQLQGMGMQQSEAAAHEAVDAMTLPDILRKLHYIWARDQQLGAPQFDFYSAAQRQRYEVTCTGGVLSGNGKKPYGSQRYGRDDKVMYVLDTANPLYVADGIVVGNGQFDHSSMCAGAPVLCAGEVTATTAATTSRTRARSATPSAS